MHRSHTAQRTGSIGLVGPDADGLRLALRHAPDGVMDKRGEPPLSQAEADLALAVCGGGASCGGGGVGVSVFQVSRTVGINLRTHRTHSKELSMSVPSASSTEMSAVTTSPSRAATAEGTSRLETEWGGGGCGGTRRRPNGVGQDRNGIRTHESLATLTLQGAAAAADGTTGRQEGGCDARQQRRQHQR